jgi:hypothetical protein
MNRAYLEEDVELIRKYFPGAQAVALRTPFDLTRHTGQRLPRLDASTFHDNDTSLQGGVLWLG